METGMILAAVDLGITNIDTIVRREDAFEHTRLSSTHQAVASQLQAVIRTLFPEGDAGGRVAVTGGQYRSLPERLGPVELVKVAEVTAIGRGGLYLAGLENALVVSAGSGTAMVAARPDGCSHVTGSAVGGGTLQGLAHLLLGTTDPQEIDRLASLGNANRADLTLVEAVGGAVGRLPVNANAVNFGRLANKAADLSTEDCAAGLVRLVGQVIAVIAINAARAEGLDTIVVTGHLVDLASICQVLEEVAGYYHADIRIPPRPGTATALGAFLTLEQNSLTLQQG
jgi:type II pantothenate kinase